MSVYQSDYYRWTEETAEALKMGNWTALDVAALVDEVEDMGKRERRSVVSRFGVILVHLLKDRYQPERAGGSWQATIRAQRERLRVLLEENPSLSAQADELMRDAYRLARLDAAAETQLSESTFPEACPFSVETVLGGPLP